MLTGLTATQAKAAAADAISVILLRLLFIYL